MRSRTGMGPSSPFLDLVLLISLPRGGGVLRQGGWGGEGELDAESNLSKLWRRVYHTISAIPLPWCYILCSVGFSTLVVRLAM